MWVKQNHNFLQKPLLFQTLDGRCSYIQIPFGQKGRPHWLNVQGTFLCYRWVISFKPLTSLTQNSKLGLPAPAASLMKEWDHIPMHELSLSSVCAFYRYLGRAQHAQQERINEAGAHVLASERTCWHEPGAPFQVFSGQRNIFVCRTGLGGADKDLPQCVCKCALMCLPFVHVFLYGSVNIHITWHLYLFQSMVIPWWKRKMPS